MVKLCSDIARHFGVGCPTDHFSDYVAICFA